jgi:ABC-type branched-subunit amino acid transport system substrate-binding protein
VGASETIRPGLAFILTGPFAAVSVTGNDGAALLEAGLLGAGLLVGELLAAELQPASNAAVTAASIQLVLFMVCHFLPGTGRKARPSAASSRAGPAETDHPSHEG